MCDVAFQTNDKNLHPVVAKMFSEGTQCTGCCCVLYMKYFHKSIINDVRKKNDNDLFTFTALQLELRVAIRK